MPLHLHRLVRAMRTRGLSCCVVSLAPLGPVATMLRDDGVDVRSCEGRCGRDFRVFRRLAKIIRAVEPKIIHALLFHANVAARRAAKRAGVPSDRVLCEIQTVEVERRWHLWVDRFTHRGCRYTIGNSPSVLEHLSQQAKIPRDRLRLVRGGIDPARIQSATPVERRALGRGITSETPIVLWVGRLDSVKGLDVLVRSFAKLSPALNAHLVLAGEGPLREKLAQQIRAVGVTDRVHLLGARSDVPGLLQTADLFVLPSRTEGLPNALLEAMAAACPIVTTDVPGCRDLITNGETGIVVPYGDVDALAESIEQLLGDRTLADRLGRAAAESVKRNWHIDQTYDAYESLYGEIIPERR
ncbi:MAG: glycosyltransferase [Planctomycetes bacterium]|nr:glycosyltransferase [Planctomycetota bacterium]